MTDLMSWFEAWTSPSIRKIEEGLTQPNPVKNLDQLWIKHGSHWFFWKKH